MCASVCIESMACAYVDVIYALSTYVQQQDESRAAASQAAAKKVFLALKAREQDSDGRVRRYVFAQAVSYAWCVDELNKDAEEDADDDDNKPVAKADDKPVAKPEDKEKDKDKKDVKYARTLSFHASVLTV